jgi:hypothetical protein
MLDLEFTTLVLPDGETVPIVGHVAEVDDSREVTDEHGQIHGIRATATLSKVLSGVAVSTGFLDPILYSFTLAMSRSAFRIPESEIVLPAGAELHVRLEQELNVSHDFGPAAPPIARSGGEVSELTALVRTLPFRTETDRKAPSDLTNLLFIGPREAVTRAFDAAGWAATDRLDASSSYSTLRAIVENQGYREAPMSTLTLAGATPALTYAKTLDTFFKRHHARVFAAPGSYRNAPLWTASSTHDVGIGFATTSKHLIHVIDEHVDDERDKIVNDFLLTGCVDGVTMIERPWIPRDARNATGNALLTDGRIAVLQLNACESPTRADDPGTNRTAVRPHATERVARSVFLTLKDDLFRGNLIYQGYWAARLLGTAKRSGLQSTATQFVSDVSGEQFQVVRGEGTVAAPGPRTTSPTSDIPRIQGFATKLEFSFSGGPSRFGNRQFSTENVDLVVPVPGHGIVRSTVSSPTSLLDGASLAPRVTLNGRRVSHEFGYSYNTTTLSVDFVNPFTPPGAATGAAQIRQFSYNVLIHVRPNGARLRPYAAVGPGFQLVRLQEALAGSSGLFNIGFKDAGLILNAWNFGSKPALEGGGIFQPMAQYGGGVKAFVAPRFLVRADFRETLSAQPDFWTKSFPTLRSQELFGGTTLDPQPLITHGVMRHRQFTFGVGIAF